MDKSKRKLHFVTRAFVRTKSPVIKLSWQRLKKATWRSFDQPDGTRFAQAPRFTHNLPLSSGSVAPK